MCQGPRAHLPTDVTQPFSLTFLLWLSRRRAAVQLGLTFWQHRWLLQCSMLGEDTEVACVCGMPCWVQPKARGPGCTVAPDPKAAAAASNRAHLLLPWLLRDSSVPPKPCSHSSSVPAWTSRYHSDFSGSSSGPERLCSFICWTISLKIFYFPFKGKWCLMQWSGEFFLQMALSEKCKIS